MTRTEMLTVDTDIIRCGHPVRTYQADYAVDLQDAAQRAGVECVTVSQEPDGMFVVDADPFYA